MKKIVSIGITSLIMLAVTSVALYITTGIVCIYFSVLPESVVNLLTVFAKIVMVCSALIFSIGVITLSVKGVSK